MTSVRVAVRVRPFNQREKDRGAKVIIQMINETQQTIITNPEDGEDKKFTFDFSYWSHDGFKMDATGYASQADGSQYADQQVVFEDLGNDVLNNAWLGFNCSLFAYGQTGSGKSYSMVGYGTNKGIIPITCNDLFRRMSDNKDENIQFRVTVSMLEIYNEQIKDLLNPKNNPTGGLKVREKPKVGVYVDGLTPVAVSSYTEVENAMEEGTRNRTVASTNMNATSSRAHTVFSLIFTQVKTNPQTKQKNEMTSKINLIDLAGSERAESTGATGDRLKEGCAINQSLSALGNVISSLADVAMGKKGVFIPYRNSVLTRLLQESLGGNAKTIMIAALSPADINYDETLSTLRYADRAKKIKNKAIVNENPTEKLIRELKEENEKLKKMGGGGGGGGDPEEMERLREELEANAKMMADLNKSWEDKLKESQELTGGHVTVDKTQPHFVNLNEDPMMSECLIYYIQEGVTTIGRKDADETQDILLSGLSINKQHAMVERSGRDCTITPLGGSKLFVNGKQVSDSTKMTQSTRVVFGNHHVFRFNDPEEASKERQKRELSGAGPLILDWEFAQKELMEAQGLSQNSSALGEKQKELEAEAKRKEDEFNKKLLELEEKMQKEKEAAAFKLEQQRKQFENALGGDDGAAAKFEKQRAELEQKNRDMEEEMETQKREMVEYAQEQRKRKQAYATLEDDMQRVLPLVREANDMAQTLEKKVVFEPKLMAGDSAEHPQAVGEGSEQKNVEVMIKVEKAVDEGHVTLLWPVDKFNQRLYMMRDVFNRFLESGEQCPHDTDPFDDPAEDRKIGSVYVYLEPLAYMLEVEANAVIMDYKGKAKGELRVEIRPCSPDGQSEPNFDIDEPDELIGKRLDFVLQIIYAKDIPVQYAYNVFCKYNFINSQLPYRTAFSDDHSTNPVFGYEKHFTVEPVTKEFLDFLLNDALNVEVRGHTEAQSKQYSFKDRWKKVFKSRGPAISKLLETAGIDLDEMKTSAKKQSISKQFSLSTNPGKTASQGQNAEIAKMSQVVEDAENIIDDEGLPPLDRLMMIKRVLNAMKEKVDTQ